MLDNYEKKICLEYLQTIIERKIYSDKKYVIKVFGDVFKDNLDTRPKRTMSVLEQQIKHTWYMHAFNDEKLIVVLYGKSFFISLHKDATWDEMIAYGESVDVERRYLENIPLRV